MRKGKMRRSASLEMLIAREHISSVWLIIRADISDLLKAITQKQSKVTLSVQKQGDLSVERDIHKYMLLLYKYNKCL